MSCIRIAKNGKPWTAVVLLLLVLALPACSRGGKEAQEGKGAVKGNAAEEPVSQPVTGVGAPETAISRGVPAGVPEEAQ